jgi:predicted AlkP superfamily pyrophosphatase or phosphodiesterase
MLVSRRMRRFLFAAILLAAALATMHAQGPRAKQVILVTIDGMRGDYLAAGDPYHLKIPTLRRLMRDGSVSERTLSVFPTLTGTAHTTLVTGVPAARHGILGNNRFDASIWTWDRDNYDFQPPFRDFADVKAETLWTAAHARGLRTAAIGWPQTAGGPIDFRTEVPVGRATETILGSITAADIRMADHYKALVAAETLVRMKPAFMAIHFSQTDSVQHALGPGTPQALVALEDTDANLAIVVDAMAQSESASEIALIVTGDHGFLPLHTELAINLPLVEAGLIKRSAGGGAPEWQAIVAPNRGLGSLYVREGADRSAVVARARSAIDGYAQKYPGRFRFVERAELDRWGADAGAAFGIEPTPGYVLDARLSPPFAQAHNRAAGHGYSPTTPGMETGLVMFGAGVRSGVRLPETRTLDIAPTIAALLALDLPKAEGQPIAGALK